MLTTLLLHDSEVKGKMLMGPAQYAAMLCAGKLEVSLGQFGQLFVWFANHGLQVEESLQGFLFVLECWEISDYLNRFLMVFSIAFSHPKQILVEWTSTSWSFKLQVYLKSLLDRRQRQD